MRNWIVFSSLLSTLLLVGCQTSHDGAEPDSCINNLRRIDGAKQQWALDHNANTNAVPTWDDVRVYLGRGIFTNQLPRCPQGGVYTIGRVDEAPRCSIPMHSLDFGFVIVVDEKENPVPDVQVSVVRSNSEAFSVRTGPDGVACIAPFQASMSDDFSDGTRKIVATKAGYNSETTAMPTSWPVRFTIRKQGE